MTNDDLAALVVKWQKILRLQDWDVKIRFGRPWEMEPDRGGEVIRIDAKKSASIIVLNPNDHDPSKIVSPDAEKTVVHELVHLHFAVIDDFKGSDDTLYEQAVELLALSLIALDRRCTPATLN